MKDSIVSGFVVGVLAAGAFLGLVDSVARVREMRLRLEHAMRSASWLEGHDAAPTRR